MKRRSTDSEADWTAAVDCPVCSHPLHGSEEETLKHIDRCLRRKPAASLSELESDPFEFSPEYAVPAGSSAASKRTAGSISRKRGRLRPTNESATQSRHGSSDDELGADSIMDDDDDVFLPLPDVGLDGDSDDGEGLPVGAGCLQVQDDWDEASFLLRLDSIDEDWADQGIGVDVGGDCADDVGRVAQEVCPATWNAIFPYQREGVRWLHNLHKQGAGGILGDEMGLGKTVQVCVHFAILAHAISSGGSTEAATRSSAVVPGRAAPDCPIFLIACPITVLHHWVNECHKWVPSLRVLVLHASMSTHFARILQSGGGRSSVLGLLRGCRRNPVNARGIIVVVSYEGLKMYSKDVLLSIASGTGVATSGWAAVCIDEGQKIRNPTTTISSICKLLPSYHRIILSGTPIQNSLKELWSLFDFICPSLLGNTLDVFDRDFASVIRAGNFKSTSILVKEMAIRTAYTLQRIIKPYLLRRKKKDLMDIAKLPDKTEHVLFCKLTPLQRSAYIDVISSDEVKMVLDKRFSAFSAITHLRKICNHPILAQYTGKLSWRSGVGLGQATIGVCNDSPVDFKDSGKLVVLSKILPQWQAEGHKVLIFTQTQAMLQLVQLMLAHLARSSTDGPSVDEKFRHIRLDGSTPVAKREELISVFNTDNSVFAMILTTKTGGVGISLTAANRVLIIDPDWNPQTDIQARERAWRIGQSRPVTVFRLISRGTIEEVIYKRQVFKLMLTGRILDNPKQRALFSRSDISELFQLVDGGTTATPGAVRPRSRMVHHRNSSANEIEKVVTARRLPGGGYASGAVAYKSGADYHNLLGDLPEEGHVTLPPVPTRATEGAGDPHSASSPSASSSSNHRSLWSAQAGRTAHGIAREEGELEDSALVDSCGAAAASEETILDLNLDLDLDLMADCYRDPTSLLLNNPNAAEELDLGEIEQMFNVDLLLDGEDDAAGEATPALQECTSSSSAQAGGPTAAVHPETREDKDKEMLRALFDGDDITAVYDHQYAEATEAHSANYTREFARRTVDRALINFTSDTLTDTASASHGSAAAISSGSMLANLRGNVRTAVSSPPGTGIGGSGDDTRRNSRRDIEVVPAKDSIMNRMLKLFKNQPSIDTGLPSSVILNYFSYLGDLHAPLFKSILQRVAVLEDGVWHLRGEYR